MHIKPSRFLFIFTLLITVLIHARHHPAPAPLNAAGTPEFPYQVYLPATFQNFDYANMVYDMTAYMSVPMNPATLYEVQHSNGSQARHQTQIEVNRFYHTKGNEWSAEWEELWADNQFIYRGTDTSPGNQQYYTLRENGQYGSRWAPRFWKVGDVFERNPTVTFYDKPTCMPIPEQSGTHRTWLRFDAHYNHITFPGGITMYNVVRFSWLLELDGPPREQYYYARGYGLVAWDGSEFGSSYISEVHAPGARPDNTRESISCLSTTGYSPIRKPGPLEWAR